MADLFTSLNASFEQILGKNASQYSEQERRDRWAMWLRVARATKAHKTWIEHECHGCVHKRGFWCHLAGLPCTVNPILTFRTAISGFACMGAGYESNKPTEANR